MSLDAAASLQLAGGLVRPGILFRLAVDPVVRIWAGAGDLEIPADGVEAAPATYRGIGELVGLPNVQALVNGVAERVEFGLSGAAIDSRAVELADIDAASVRGAQVNLGLLLFDEHWAPVADVLWLWQGEADTPKIRRATDAAGNVTRAISISVGSIFTARRRPALAYYTDVDQKRRSPDDRFCERTPLYSYAVDKPWPRF